MYNNTPNHKKPDDIIMEADFPTNCSDGVYSNGEIDDNAPVIVKGQVEVNMDVSAPPVVRTEIDGELGITPHVDDENQPLVVAEQPSLSKPDRGLKRTARAVVAVAAASQETKKYQRKTKKSKKVTVPEAATVLIKKAAATAAAPLKPSRIPKYVASFEQTRSNAANLKEGVRLYTRTETLSESNLNLKKIKERVSIANKSECEVYRNLLTMSANMLWSLIYFFMAENNQEFHEEYPNAPTPPAGVSHQAIMNLMFKVSEKASSKNNILKIIVLFIKNHLRKITPNKRDTPNLDKDVAEGEIMVSVDATEFPSIAEIKKYIIQVMEYFWQTRYFTITKNCDEINSKKIRQTIPMVIHLLHSAFFKILPYSLFETQSQIINSFIQTCNYTKEKNQEDYHQRIHLAINHYCLRVVDKFTEPGQEEVRDFVNKQAKLFAFEHKPKRTSAASFNSETEEDVIVKVSHRRVTTEFVKSDSLATLRNIISMVKQQHQSDISDHRALYHHFPMPRFELLQKDALDEHRIEHSIVMKLS